MNEIDVRIERLQPRARRHAYGEAGPSRAKLVAWKPRACSTAARAPHMASTANSTH